ncbi:MAG: hypothetical protein HPY57_08450 [Ignavibacteria bacterium]|nr:hypothetical protein [Ignavibacteria bacterium]
MILQTQRRKEHKVSQRSFDLVFEKNLSPKSLILKGRNYYRNEEAINRLKSRRDEIIIEMKMQQKKLKSRRDDIIEKVKSKILSNAKTERTQSFAKISFLV